MRRSKKKYDVIKSISPKHTTPRLSEGGGVNVSSASLVDDC